MPSTGPEDPSQQRHGGAVVDAKILGLVVDRTVAVPAEGLRSFLRHEVMAQSFDADAYNRAAREQFSAAIGAHRRQSAS
jgi:hypothetical protein